MTTRTPAGSPRRLELPDRASSWWLLLSTIDEAAGLADSALLLRADRGLILAAGDNP